MSDKRLLDAEYVARAIFLPAMLDSNGKISLAAFTLRHNEGYFSVARMAVKDWLDDLKRIPTSAGVSATGLLMMIQTKLSQLAEQSYIAMTNKTENKETKTRL